MNNLAQRLNHRWQKFLQFGLFVLITTSLFISLSACGVAVPTSTPVETVQLTPSRAAPTSPPLPSATPTVVSGTVTIWHAWDESELPALAIIIKAFQQEYPDVYFDVTYIAEQDLINRYQNEALQGQGPDILLGPASWGDELEKADLVMDLSELAERSLLETLNQPAFQISNIGQKIVSLPYSLEGVVLIRNKDVMTLSADSLQELVSLSQSATQGETVGSYLERSFFYSGAHLTGLGGQMMNADSSPAFNTPEGLTWIELLQMFESAGPTSFQTDVDLLAFKEGKVGWIIDGTWNLQGIIESLGPENIAIDPWPTFGPGRMSGYVQSENIYLNSKISSSQLLASWNFAKFLISPTAQAHLGDAGKIPAASGANLTDPVNGPLLMQAMTALANGVPYPITPYLSAYEVQINIALQSIFQGSSPGASLQIAQGAIQEEVLVLQSTVTPTP